MSYVMSQMLHLDTVTLEAVPRLNFSDLEARATPKILKERTAKVRPTSSRIEILRCFPNPSAIVLCISLLEHGIFLKSKTSGKDLKVGSLATANSPLQKLTLKGGSTFGSSKIFI